jgi:hypothetical protein
VVDQLCVDGVDGDLATVVDWADPSLDRPGGVDRRVLTGPLAPEPADFPPLSMQAPAILALVVDVRIQG